LLPGPVSPDCCRGSGRIVRQGFGGSSTRAGKGMRASGRSSRLAVVHSPRRGVAVASPGGPLRLSGRDRRSEALLDAFSVRSLQVLPHRLRAASGWPISRRSAPWFPKPSACAPVSPNQGSHPFRLFLPASSRTCVPPSASFPAVLARRVPLSLRKPLTRPARLPVEPCSAVPRNLGSAWAALRFRNLQELSHPRTVPECGFPKAPAPFPARVSF
jgi:hypothetical protein